MSKRILAVALLISLPVGGILAGEREEVSAIASRYGWEEEVRLPDGTRCDLVSPRWAIEVDWAPKWAEGIGQALYYAEVLDKEPVVLLILKRPEDERYVKRCLVVARKYKFKVFVANEGNPEVKERPLPATHEGN